MKKVTQLALELNITPQELIKKLAVVDIIKKSMEDDVSEADEIRLINHYKSHRPIRRNKTSITAISSSDGTREIPVTVRKRRIIPREKSPEISTWEKAKNEKPAVTDLAIENINLDFGSLPGKKVRWSKLDSIEISNFKAIDNLSVPLADVTILVGPNGSGKSSILQAIHWAARAASYVSPRYQTEVVSFERLDYSPSSEPLKSAHKKELSQNRDSDPVTVVFNHVSTDDGSSSAVTIKIRAARGSAGISVHIEGGSAVSPFKQREELITTYIPGLAGLSEKETLLVQPLLRRQAAGGDAGGVLRNILFNIASRQPGEVDNEISIERVRQLNELVQIIHPGVSLEVSFNDREDINIQAVFDDNTLSGVKRPLEAAATGVLQVIQIFAYLILFRPKILLVDEPDAHLHPDKQERLIDALEQAASRFDTQVILTTHSPHIARAASPLANLLWVNQGKVLQQQEETIRTLLGWGGLDKKILFFVEDENDHAIRAILRQWPHLYRQLSICRCFGVDNLPGNSLLKGLLSSDSFDVKIIIHRDRDFMTSQECKMWSQRYTEDDVKVWVTEYSDAEAYFCRKEYLACLYGISIDTAAQWIKSAAPKCNNARKVFFEKRKVFIRLLYENGGSPASDVLWEESLESEAESLLGKTLHRALKEVVKAAGYNEKLLDKFSIPEKFEVAPELRSIIEHALSEENNASD